MKKYPKISTHLDDFEILFHTQPSKNFSKCGLFWWWFHLNISKASLKKSFFRQLSLTWLSKHKIQIIDVKLMCQCLMFLFWRFFFLWLSGCFCSIAKTCIFFTSFAHAQATQHRHLQCLDLIFNISLTTYHIPTNKGPVLKKKNLPPFVLRGLSTTSCLGL